ACPTRRRCGGPYTCRRSTGSDGHATARIRARSPPWSACRISPRRSACPTPRRCGCPRSACADLLPLGPVEGRAPAPDPDLVDEILQLGQAHLVRCERVDLAAGERERRTGRVLGIATGSQHE